MFFGRQMKLISSSVSIEIDLYGTQVIGYFSHVQLDVFPALLPHTLHISSPINDKKFTHYLQYMEKTSLRRFITMTIFQSYYYHYFLQVAALKQKIETEQGASFPAANLKLIYAGIEPDYYYV